VLLLCAPVTLLFTFADTLALQRFSPGVFALRAIWSAELVAAALALGRVSASVERRLMTGVAVSSSVFFAVITWFTGGFASPLFHWILAMPLVIAVVLQEFPGATFAAAAATLGSGLAIVLGSGQGVAMAAEWAVQAFGMCALAVYASVTYRRLRFREQAMREAAAVANERARASDAEVRARDLFLSMAAHELRTPLTAVVLNVERLSRSTRAAGTIPEAARASIEGVHRQVFALSRLVESLLDISRLTGDATPPRPVTLEVGSFVEQVIERYRPTAQKHGYSVLIDQQSRAMVSADRTRLEQVLVNLLANAVKFGGGQPITVSIAAREDVAEVTVSDRGVGIPAADQQRIFERFDRGSAPPNEAGLGLGLWISRRLVEQMGGQLRVDSRPEDDVPGARFTVALPIAAAESAGPGSETASS
jgi:signal transduction histidine kinase